MAQTLGLIVKINTLADSAAVKNLTGIQQRLESLKDSASKLSVKGEAVQSFQNLAQSVKASSTRLEYLRSTFGSTSQSLETSRARTSALSAEYDKARQRVSRFSQTMPKNSSLLMFAKKRADELGRAYKESSKHTETLQREHDRLYRAAGEAQSRFDSETSSLREMQAALSQAGIDTNNLAGEQQRLAQTSQRLERAQNRLADIKSRLTMSYFTADLAKSTAAA